MESVGEATEGAIGVKFPPALHCERVTLAPSKTSPPFSVIWPSRGGKIYHRLDVCQQTSLRELVDLVPPR